MIDDLRIYDQALSAGDVQEVLGNSGASSKPTPAPWAVDVARDVVLGWKPGKFAKTHDVYFGTVFDDVNNASTDSPTGVLASQGQDANTFDPAPACSPSARPTTGGSMRSMPRQPTPPSSRATLELHGRDLRLSRSSPSRPRRPASMTAMGPEKTIDGSGLDAKDEHSTSAIADVAQQEEPVPGLDPI